MTNAEWDDVIYRALEISLRERDRRSNAISVLQKKAAGIAKRPGMHDTVGDLGPLLDTLLGENTRAHVDEILTDPDAPERVARHFGGANDVAAELYRQVIIGVKRHLLNSGTDPSSPWQVPDRRATARHDEPQT